MLSIHSIIVGLALGAQSSATSAVIVLIAIMAHKSVAGFALGISYRRAGHSLRGTLPVAAFFSSMTPMGILAGTAIGALIPPVGQRIFEAVFDSVGAGTFLYIATVDRARPGSKVNSEAAHIKHKVRPIRALKTARPHLTALGMTSLIGTNWLRTQGADLRFKELIATSII